ncbi:MAG: hypothetical protein LH478_10490 [Chitinophagaceae bacterium]|nr:hypothetical protein [Chitinophagaceae bacterium]
MFLKPVLFLTIIACCLGCTPRQNSRNKMAKPIENLQLNAGNQALNKIVFLTFEVTLTDSAHEEYAFRLINKTFSSGTLKKGRQGKGETNDRGFLYYTLDENNTKPIFAKVPDPLEMQLEYPGENQSMEKKTFYRKKGEVTLRFQFEKSSKTISIFKVAQHSQALKKVYYATL